MGGWRASERPALKTALCWSEQVEPVRPWALATGKREMWAESGDSQECGRDSVPFDPRAVEEPEKVSKVGVGMS